MGRKLLFAFTFASDRSADGFSMPTPATVIAFGNSHVVALADANASPQAGKVGYYSDGARHAVVAVISAAGRRLFFEMNGDALSSNVWEFLNP